MKDEEILSTALQRFDRCLDAESDNRDRAVDDLRFASGDQWPEDIRKLREEAGRPVLTINKIPAFTRQVINDIRQMRPAIKVRPVDSQADPETAEILNGMIRAIESDSNAETAYDWAATFAVKGGWGYFKIVAEYEDGASFDQVLKIKRVKNPFTIYIDPDHQEHDGSDIKFAFEVDRMPRDEFEEKYPDATSQWDAQGYGDSYRREWFDSDTVRVAKYWSIEEETRDISLVLNPETGGTEIWPGAIKGAIQTRKVTDKKVICRKITGAEVLETYDWMGKYIPIIPVIGEEEDIEGETLLKGMVRDLRDPAIHYNLMRSASAEVIASQIKGGWIGPEGSFVNPKWKTANTANYAYLEYKPQPGGPPQKIEPPQISPAFVQESMTSAEEMKQVSGIYNAGLGDRSNEVSGVAISGRQMESDVSNYHFADNLARAIKHCGKILVDLIPKIYSGPRMIQIIEPDGNERGVLLNQPYVDDNQKDRFYNLQAGRYDATVDVGPSYTTQRQEASETMLELLKAFPAAAPIVGDLFAKNLDFPGADEIAKRLKLLLPPEIFQDENPQVKGMIQQMKSQYDAQSQQMQGYIQALEQQLQNLNMQLQNKQGELAIKAAEVQRKSKNDNQDHAVDVSKLELEYGKALVGGLS